MKTFWSLKTKLILTFLGIGIAPLMLTMAIAYQSADHEIHVQGDARVDALGADRTHQIESYFKNEFSGLTNLASTNTVKSAIVQFDKAFETYKSTSPSQNVRSMVEDFYTGSFSAEYTKNNPGESFDVKGYIAEFDNASINAQYDYIANNEHPVGSKNNLVTAKRTVAYNTPHASFHPELADYLKRHELYDLFLVNPAGRVVYSVFKETDFATNLSRGNLANSGLGRALSQSIRLKDGEVYVDDFARYPQSYEAPASFAGTPIFSDGKLLGAIIIQLPLNKISSIVANRDGLGELGQVLLFGQDGRLRADAFRQQEKYNVAAIFKKDSTVKMESPIITAALEGKTGNGEATAYDGVKIVASYRPIKIANLNWAIISQIGESELYAGLYRLRNAFILILTMGAFMIGGCAWLMSRSIANKLQNIILSLSESSRQVSSASTEADQSASTLSEAATEQAASLQETMASAEEISAMISQNAESAAKAKQTVEANDQSTKEGSAAVIDMVSAISEIKTTNEQILDQMKSSNKEFAEIVQIISEIGEKTKVINDIVFQTKLLSFNASVEAARAGEHGKGFAVVAEEVGNLAQMSGNAAKEITDMLSASIKRVNLIVEQTKTKVEQLVEIGKDKITMGQSTADRCKVALNRLSTNAAMLTSMVTEIAHASKEQAQGVKEINTAISQLDQVTQQNSAVARQSSVQADTLLKETESLNISVGALVTFVQGGTLESSKGASATTSVNQTKEREEGTTKSKPASFAKVATLTSLKKKPELHKISPEHSTQQHKIAAGSEFTPSNRNKQFEDF